MIIKLFVVVMAEGEVIVVVEEEVNSLMLHCNVKFALNIATLRYNASIISIKTSNLLQLLATTHLVLLNNLGRITLMEIMFGTDNLLT